MPGKEKTALECAAQYLLRRQHTKMELRRKLYAKEKYTKSEVESALAELERHSFLDDARFAEDFANAMKGRSLGALRIKNKLREKGVDSETVDRVISEVTSPSDESARALKALEKKRSALMREPDKLKRRAKALRHLASKGFSGSVAYSVVSRFLEGSPDTEEYME